MPEFNNEKILIIGAGPLQTPAIIQAKKMGLTVLATDMDPRAVGFGMAHGHALISTLDAPATVAYAAREKVQGVLTLATDMPLVTVAAVARALGLSAAMPPVAERATNKYKMKKALAAAGVPCPKFELASSPAQAAAAAKKIGWPVVTKPLLGSASRGVKLSRDDAELERAFLAAREVAKKKQAVIEEYALGKHICVEAFTWNRRTRILCIIDRIVTPPPQFVELRHTHPSTLAKKQQAEIGEIVTAGIRALGLEAGPSHTDMIVTPRGPLISEIGCRLDGDYKSSHFMPLVFGYNIIADTIRAAMGRAPLLFERDIRLKPKSALCIHYFTPPPGIVKTVRGASAARRIPGVRHFKLNLRPGAKIVPFTRSQDRIGVVITSADTAKHAAAIAKNVEHNITISY